MSAPPIPAHLLALDLQARSSRKRTEAGLAVATDATSLRYQVTLVEAGVVEPLVRQLKEQGDERVEAAIALARLAKRNPVGQMEPRREAA